MKKLDEIRMSLGDQWDGRLYREDALYLLRVADAALRYDSGIPGHAIKDFATGEHEADCAACALHAALGEEA